MAKKFNTESTSEFFNHDYDYVVYYDKSKHSLKVFPGDKLPKNRRNLIQTPFHNSVSYHARKIFRENLTPKERRVVNSFPYRHGFFEFLRETGLIYKYYWAEEEAAKIVINEWIEYHDLPDDWNS